MNVWDEVAKEALHDWLANREPVEQPSPAEYLDDEELRVRAALADPDSLRDAERWGK